MPFPLIPVAILGVATLVGGGLVVALPKLSKNLAGKRVAILGRQSVGKTTLLRTLRDGDAPDRALRTVDASLGGRFEMAIRTRTVEFDVPRDLPGNDSDLGFKHWKDAFCGADYVWYLFRADLVARGDVSALDGVKDHLDRFKDWMDSDKSVRPTVILIGTYADLVPDYEGDVARVEEAVRSVSAIKLGMVKLNHASLVIGSLLTDKESKKLIKSLGGHL